MSAYAYLPKGKVKMPEDVWFYRISVTVAGWLAVSRASRCLINYQHRRMPRRRTSPLFVLVGIEPMFSSSGLCEGSQINARIAAT
ncbi:hypothetical protein AXG93_1513s1110 [Marchantia polymorpha subsp. ruderalis]|uniref:Uncharacterized protein n=1 Tax=Marchantia polymorpha subsp. ruderalis TaxID=1480154 RepID=A0A176WC19_MARPO|nr:hypothetical protein AXG93_1513s1110 [Marchantia polymorpha subsp. ruderalis]